MYFASIDLPADWNDETVSTLAEVFCGLETASSALRQGSHKGPWTIEWLFDQEFSKDFLARRVQEHCENHQLNPPAALELKTGSVPDQDWLAASYREFQPFCVGPFFIYGSHYGGMQAADHIGLLIDASTAFGSGQHGTTKGCLEALLELNALGHQPSNILDMGTGSGILAVAAAKLWDRPVLAVDNDPAAERLAKIHQQLNNIPESQMTCSCGDGFRDPLTQSRAPYDLVIANILASALKEMANDLANVTAPKGFVILSGILNEQANSVLKRYGLLGFIPEKTFEIGEWTSLLLRRKSL